MLKVNVKSNNTSLTLFQAISKTSPVCRVIAMLEIWGTYDDCISYFFEYQNSCLKILWYECLSIIRGPTITQPMCPFMFICLQTCLQFEHIFLTVTPLIYLKPLSLIPFLRSFRSYLVLKILGSGTQKVF